MGYRNIVASFADVRGVDLGGITFDFAKTDDGHRLRERAGGSGRGVAQTGGPGGGAVGRRKSGDSRGGIRDDDKRDDDKRKQEHRGTKSSTCASWCPARSFPSRSTHPARRSGGAPVRGRFGRGMRRVDAPHHPIRVTGQEPERVVWEVRTKAK